LLNFISRNSEEATAAIARVSGMNIERAQEYAVEQGFWTFGEKVYSRYVDNGKYGIKPVSVVVKPIRGKNEEFISAGGHLSGNVRSLPFRGPKKDKLYLISIY